ncbi:MAG: hypothetical protein EBU96_10355 [Actinobacteria bacterium]|nr:hypothetical protein [Actinomycetota bacterium]
MITYRASTQTARERITAIEQDHYLAIYAIFWEDSSQGGLVQVVYQSHESFLWYDALSIMKSARIGRFFAGPSAVYLWGHYHVGNVDPGYVALFII